MIVGFFSHLRLLFTLILPIPFFFMMMWYIKSKYGDEQGLFALQICFIVLALQALPVLFLHIYYWYVNRGMTVKTLGRKVVVQSPKGELVFDITEIKVIELKVTISHANGGFKILPSENYMLGRIELKSGQKVVVTTLLDYGLIWLKGLRSDLTSEKVRPLCF